MDFSETSVHIKVWLRIGPNESFSVSGLWHSVDLFSLIMLIPDDAWRRHMWVPDDALMHPLVNHHIDIHVMMPNPPYI